MEKMPVLFLGHGSPMNAVSDNEFTRSLKALAKTLPKAKAILLVSAHWLTEGTHALSSPKPKTIHDFYGFPQDLYRITYSAPGRPQLAKRLSMIEPIEQDATWGLDHASWTLLRHLYPKADMPVVELSLDYGFNDWHPKPVRYHYELAKKLKPLREEGVLIIGSGNLVHNLGVIDYETDAPVMDWAEDLDKKVKKNLQTGNHKALIDFNSMGPSARMGIPTWDHYLPLIYAVGLQEKGEEIEFTYEGFQNGSISMRGFRIG